VLDLLRERDATDILVFGGGTIPPADLPYLTSIGLAAVFTPGTPARTIVETIRQCLSSRVPA